MRIRETQNLTPLATIAVLSLVALVPACSMDEPCSAGETFRVFVKNRSDIRCMCP